jgi:hypothetical protein
MMDYLSEDAKVNTFATKSTTGSVKSLVDPNRYQQLLEFPIAALVRSTDERPDVPGVVVLGYN